MKSPAASPKGAASEFERRAARAVALSGQSPASEAPLRFAAGLYLAQGAVASSLEAAHAAERLSGHFDRDLDRFLDRLPAIFRYAAENGPPALADDAGVRMSDDPPTRRARLLVLWTGDRQSREDYLSRAALRPYVETLRALTVAPDRPHKQGRCPFCGGLPWVSVRREGSLMEGARRLLACALCGGEWPFNRILCPSCFEQDPVKLPSFSAEPHANVRIEACETCRRYVKSIDLSTDARPIPEVDDLLSLSLDLWAIDQGFERIEPGLAGI